MTAYALLLWGALLGASGGSSAGAPPRVESQAHINQGTPQTVISPDRRWSVEVRPEAGEDESARLVLRDQQSGAEHRLFDLERDGTLAWSKDGSWLAVEDLQSAESYRVLFFSLAGTPSRESDAAKVDALVRSLVLQRLGPERTMQYYFPRFVAFTRGGAIVSVAATTTHGDSGPMTAHCFGYEVALDSPKVLRLVSQDELKQRFGATCETVP